MLYFTYQKSSINNIFVAKKYCLQCITILLFFTFNVIESQVPLPLSPSPTLTLSQRNIYLKCRLVQNSVSVVSFQTLLKIYVYAFLVQFMSILVVLVVSSIHSMLANSTTCSQRWNAPTFLYIIRFIITYYYFFVPCLKLPCARFALKSDTLILNVKK